ncbi:MAG TPA: aldose 1-epimerase [Saprospiraceae bacterium]|mgnify:FL=1|nr:aldose 1-epimerase [Saprospiraceae bacterium]
MKWLFTTGRCSINDRYSYNGMQIIYLENDFLKMGILAGRGADIFELIYKPFGVNMLLKLEKDIHPPTKISAQRKDSLNQFEEYYYGGWQTIFPNSVPMNYFGSHLGQHGEVWHIPWNYSIVKNEPEEVEVKLYTEPLRMPFRLEKTLILKAGKPTFSVKEKIINTGSRSLPVMWGQHVAFGLPWLEKGGIVHTHAKQVEVETKMPFTRLLTSGHSTHWPKGVTSGGKEIDLSLIPSVEEGHYSDLVYLSDFKDTGTYTITDVEKRVAFTLEWDKNIFPYLWFWQERYATHSAPWWGKTYAIALEPWTCKWNPDPDQQIDEGLWLTIDGGQSRETEMKVMIHSHADF